jgi:glycosyltransferase involved in cell wall biosynthesis
MNARRLAILCDFPEEGWPSMDLVSEMLLKELKMDSGKGLFAQRVCPPFCRRVQRLPLAGPLSVARSADRLLNRHFDYPRSLRSLLREFACFHVCDHSYAHLVHALPAERTGVFCHDLDAFRCLLEPRREGRPRWFKAIARYILRGLQKAALVFHSTQAVRQQIEHYGLLDMSRLVHAPYGVVPAFLDRSAQAEPLPDRLAGLQATPFVLHVGSCIRRKRIDVLLNVFAGARAKHPRLRLVQVGGDWTASQRQQIDQLGIASAVIQLRELKQIVLAALYRRANLVLLTSEAEGFGLPIIEALASGTTVIASDIPSLREVGAEAVTYCPPGDVAAWVQTVNRFLDRPEEAPARSVRLAHARRYSWAEHARIILSAYEQL